MENYLRRSIAYLESIGADPALVAAMRRVPFAPAESYYEGLVAWNLIFYFDGCDNLTITCDSNSTAYQYAVDNGIDYLIMPQTLVVVPGIGG